MTDTRAAFEAWWGHVPDRKEDGYLAHNVNVRWEAWRDSWQAAINHERSECAKVCEEVRGLVPPHTIVHDSACEDCAAAIRARSDAS